MCVAAGVPLVESGTAGYYGQVQPILKVGYKTIHALFTEILLDCYRRTVRNALIVGQNPCRSPFLSARYVARPANLYTASFGQKAI